MKLSQSRKDWLGRTTDKYVAARPTWVDSYLAARGISPTDADTFRLGYVDAPDAQHQMYAGRLSIPFLTPTGVVSLRFRCLEDHDCSDKDGGGCGAKYLGGAEETRLYNVEALHRADSYVGITEGELDAVVSTLAGIPAVGVPGAHHWKPYWTRLFADFDRVLLLGDGDTPGRDFVNKVLGLLPNAEARTLPPGHDVSSFVLEQGDLNYIQHAIG